MPAALQTTLVAQSWMMLVLLPMLVVLQTLTNEIFMYNYPEPTTERIRVIWASTAIAFVLTLLALIFATILHDACRISTDKRSYMVFFIITPFMLLIQTAISEIFYYIEPQPTGRRLTIISVTSAITTVLSLLLCVFLCSEYGKCVWKQTEHYLCYASIEKCDIQD